MSQISARERRARERARIKEIEQLTRPKLRRRIWLGFWWVVIVGVILLHAVGGWVFAGKIVDQAFVVSHDPPVDNVVVQGVTGDQITLQADGATLTDLGRPIRMGFIAASGYLQLTGPPVASSDTTVTRTFGVLEGTAPTVGTQGRADPWFYPEDVASEELGIQTVTYTSPLGTFETWQTSGSKDLWVIHVHGKGANPREAVRLMRALSAAGYPQLSITYRNDEGQPQDPSGYYQYGVTEWNDLEAAIQYAQAQRASGVVLVGYSTGGAIALATEFRHRDDVVKAMVLDAPNLNMAATVAEGAKKESLPLGIPLPPTLTWTATQIAGIQLNISWEALDYASRGGQIGIPTLVFHGVEDDVVPISTSRELADRQPNYVTLVEVPAAGHVESWNADPSSYEQKVLDLLAEVGG